VLPPLIFPPCRRPSPPEGNLSLYLQRSEIPASWSRSRISLLARLAGTMGIPKPPISGDQPSAFVARSPWLSRYGLPVASSFPRAMSA